MIVKPSETDYATTLAALLGAIEQRGLTVFARIDHAAGAREVGLELDDEEVIVFGNPRAGTVLMQSDPRIGIELPLRVLVWSEREHASVGYEDPRELRGRFDVAAQEQTLTQMATLLAALADEAAASARD